jgi:hypothetical protein
MRSKILLFPVLFFAITSFSQDSSFQLKDYKYRTPGFRALSIGINFSGNASSSKTEGLTGNSARSFYLMPSRLHYSRLISTEKRTHTSYINLAPYGQSYYTETNGKAAKSKNFSYDFHWDRNDRFYKNNQWFFEIGNRLSNSLGTNRHRDTAFNSKNNNLEIEDKVTLGFGKGRIEIVQDAQMALYILNDLEKEGLLNGPVAADVALNLAKLITEINNQRIFDSRKKRIYELTRIESFLRSSGLADKTDIRHFTIINDNWALAFNPYRLSGANWFVRFIPSAGFSKNTSQSEQIADKTNTRSEQKFLAVSPVIGYENYKPINLKWQRNMGINLSYQSLWHNIEGRSTFNGNSFFSEIDSHESQMRWYSFYGIGYFPNNRTLLNANLVVEAVHIKYDNNPLKKSTVIKPSLNFSTDYFISYKTRLSAYWNLQYDLFNNKTVMDTDSKGHYFSTSLSLGLSHSIL